MGFHRGGEETGSGPLISPRALSGLLLVSIAVAVSPTALAQFAGIRGAHVTVPGASYTNAGPSTLKEMLARTNFFVLNVHIPYDRVEQGIGQLPSNRETPILVCCQSGRMSTTAVETVVQLG